MAAMRMRGAWFRCASDRGRHPRRPLSRCRNQGGRGGDVVLDVAIGAADAAQTQPLQHDSVFNIFSVTKAFTNLLVLQAVEQGRFQLTTPISTLIPEFAGQGREKILIWHLLSHQAGFPIIFEVEPGWYIDDFAAISRTVIAKVAPVEAPCTKVAYSPLANHVLMAEALLRTDPARRSYRQIVHRTPRSARHARHGGGLRADCGRARSCRISVQLSHRHKSRNTPGPNARRGRARRDAVGRSRRHYGRPVPLRTCSCGGAVNGARLISPR